MFFTKLNSLKRSHVKAVTTTVLISAIAFSAVAQAGPPLRNRAVIKDDNMIYNPVAKTWSKGGTADPTARVWPGIKAVFLYTSTDSNINCRINGTGGQAKSESLRPWGNTGFCMPGYQVFKNTKADLHSDSWIRQGSDVRLHQEDVGWARKASAGFGGSATMWAPDVVKADDGNYHMFFPSVTTNGVQTIGVAYAHKPEGPFMARGKPIANMAGTFDPSVIKVGKQWYIFYAKHAPKTPGSAKAIYVAKIDSKFKSVTNATNLKLEKAEDYLEGPHAYTVNGRLFLQWASVTAKPQSPYPGGYQIKHAPAWNNKNPLHFFNVKGGGVLVAPWGNKGTNHGSFVKWSGKYYDFFHDHMTSKNNGYNPTVANQTHSYRQAGYSQVSVDANNRPNWFRPDKKVKVPTLSNK